MEIAEAKRLKELERENAELKQVVAELTLDNGMLRHINQKKVLRLSDRRRAVDALKRHFDVGERRACRVLEIHRSSYRYPNTGGAALGEECECRVFRIR